ncbi:DUF4843 domain-containing protein [Chitinophaga lutea]
MKRNYLLLLLPVVLAMACKKNEPLLYEEKPAVYFSAFSDKDSLVHSMLGAKTNNDTVFVAIRLLGNKADKDRQVTLRVNAAFTNAKEGLHFEKLKDSYTFPANAFTATIPVVLYKTDPQLSHQYFRLGLDILPSADFGAGYPYRLTARILFTNELVKPDYWDAFLKLYYGDYSKAKHQKIIDIQGFDFPAVRASIPTAMYGTLMSWGRVVCKYYTDNTEYDENGNRILPWAAF